MLPRLHSLPRAQRIATFGNPPYDAATDAFLRAMPTPLLAAQEALIDSFIRGLKLDGLWDKIDGGNILCLGTAAQCYVDFKNPSRVATVYSAPTFTFTANRQFYGSGSADTVNLPDSINTGFVPSTAGGQMTQNSAFLGVYRIQNGGTTSTRIFAGANAVTNDLVLTPRSTGDVFTGRVNNGTSDTLVSSITNGTGFFLALRTAAAETYGQYNATQGSVVTRASAGLPDVPIRYLQVVGGTGVLSSEGIALGIYGGGGFTLADGLLLNSRVQTLMSGLRAL